MLNEEVNVTWHLLFSNILKQSWFLNYFDKALQFVSMGAQKSEHQVTIFLRSLQN